MIFKNYILQFQNVWNSSPDDGKNPLQIIYVISLGFLIGLCAGSIVAFFRISGYWAYDTLLAWTGAFSHSPLVIFCWFVLCVVAALLVGYLIRNWAIRFGGAQWIIDALKDGQPRPWYRILVPKFIGSWLVLACGVSVGMEGPSIEMGASTALGLKHFDVKESFERRYFILGGSAAGLAAAFSAPFAGICYVYEIMKEKMNPLLFLFMLAGSFGVYISTTLIFGLGVMINLETVSLPHLKDFWLLVPLALFAGLGGIIYNYLLRFSMFLYKSQTFIPIYLRPLFPFLGAFIMMLFFPVITGEGMTIFPHILDNHNIAGYLCLFVAAKIIFTAFCYGSGVPAGLMVPVICIGAALGAIYGDWAIALDLLSPHYYGTCVVLGMGACFAAAERAPVTALVLVSQMTGAFEASAGLLFVAAIASMFGRVARVRSA